MHRWTGRCTDKLSAVCMLPLGAWPGGVWVGVGVGAWVWVVVGVCLQWITPCARCRCECALIVHTTTAQPLRAINQLGPTALLPRCRLLGVATA
jgi:hypothetical protein